MKIQCIGDIKNIDEVYSKIGFTKSYKSDEEMIKKAFKVLGIELFRLCEGDFILKICDKDTVYLCRGPSYRINGYYEVLDNNVNLYSSIEEIPDKEKKFLEYEEAIQNMATNKSFFKNVYKLRYHELVTITKLNRKINNYILSDPRFEKDVIFDEEYCKQRILDSMSKIFVGYDLQSKNKVASLVSGGIDSSVVTYQGWKVNKNIDLFSLGTLKNNEFKESQVFGNFINKKVSKMIVDEKEYLKVYPLVVYLLEHFDSEIIEYMIPVVLAYKHLQGKYKNIISGYGSDILFGGFSKGDAFLTGKLVLDEFSSLSYSNEMSRKIDDFFNVTTYYPYFEREFLHLSFKISVLLKTKNNKEKYQLRKSYEGILPDEVVWRKKIGVHEGSGCEKFFSNLFPNSDIESIRDRKNKLSYLVFKKIFIDCIPIEKIEIERLIKKYEI